MFGPQIAALRFTAKSAARRAKWGALGGLAFLVALFFFSIAVWIVLERAFGPLGAALVLGILFLLLGLLAFAWSRYPPRVIPRETAETMQNPMRSPALSTAAIVNAVVMGIAAGRAVRRRK